MVQRVSEKVSELDEAPIIRRDMVIPVADPRVASYQVPLSRITQVFNVLNYATAAQGAQIVAGTLDPATAFLAADSAAVAAGGGTIYAPRGTYGTGSNWVFALSSGNSLEGDGEVSVLRNCYLTATGAAGSEVAFTAPATKGAYSLSIPGTGLSGAWLRISSCINSESPNAGRDQLGHVTADQNYLGEYVRVRQGNALTVDLQGATLWAYSNTPGSDTHVSITTSVARVMSFHEGGRIRRIKMLGKNTSQGALIKATFARDFIIEDVTLDTNDTTARCVHFMYCLDSHVHRSRLVGKKTSVPGGSTANNFYCEVGQGCTISDSTIYYGNQGVDFAEGFQDLTYRGGGSIECTGSNNQSFDCATEGFTTHWGGWGNSFVNCRTRGSPRGIRLRGRGDSAIGCKCYGDQANGIGVYIDNAAAIDSEVLGNTCVGFLYGMQYSHSASGYEALEALLLCGSARIEGNHVRDSVEHGIYVTTGYTSATLCGPTIAKNEVHNPGRDAIRIQAYNNGTVAEENRLVGIGATWAGVRWEANIKRLTIGTNDTYGVNATGFALVGPGVAVAITDAVTFPGGNAEALWVIKPQRTDAAPGFMQASVIRDVTAYATATVPGYQPNVQPMGTSGPTAERQTMGFYLSGSSLRADTRDTANAFVTHQLNIRGAGSPEGAVTAAIGSTYQRTDGGAATSFYVKESGSGNTGWVAK